MGSRLSTLDDTPAGAGARPTPNRLAPGADVTRGRVESAGRRGGPGSRARRRTLGWPQLAALASGRSSQSVFLLGIIIARHGTAAVPLLLTGLVLSMTAAPGWVELALMWPDRVGGIAACCAEAFRPYSAVLASLAGVCYWWGWVPACGLSTALAAYGLHEWYLPGIPVQVLAGGVLVAIMAVTLRGAVVTARLALGLASAATLLALGAALIPVVFGQVDWDRATDWHLTLPFDGPFGAITGGFAGLYLIGFIAPGFEAAACHVGESRDPRHDLPRAMLASGSVSLLACGVLPIVLLGAIGPMSLQTELTRTLGPAFAPLLGSAAHLAAIWFVVFGALQGTVGPLSGASRTLGQLADDGLLPRALGARTGRGVPWVATLLTGVSSFGIILLDLPSWTIAAGALTYLLGVTLPSVAVWLLRRHQPAAPRPYRAPRGTIGLGLAAAAVWLLAIILGLQQFGLPTALGGLGLAWSGAALYAWRLWRDRPTYNAPRRSSLYLKLTAPLLAIIAINASGYLLAIDSVQSGRPIDAALTDVFVLVALLSIGVGLVLPGSIARASREASVALKVLALGTVADLTRAMRALAAGDLDGAHARVDARRVAIRSRDEVGEIAQTVLLMQQEVARAAIALDGAREGLRSAESRLEDNLDRQAAVAELGRRALETLDPGVLVTEAVHAVHRTMDVDIAAAVACDDASRRLHLHAQVGLPDAASSRTVPLADPAVAQSLRLRAPLQGGRGSSPLARMLDPGAAATLLMPIHGAETPWGALLVQSRSPRVFSGDETAFLLTVGNVIAEAIQRIAVLEEVRRQALHDPLTGLPNRNLFAEHLTRALAGLARAPGQVGVLFLDLDNFKLINDSRGHTAGDEVLRHAARTIDAAIRPGDTVARFGGDEFVVLCPDLPVPGEAARIAERIGAGLGRPFTVDDADHRMSTSIGIALATGPGRSAEDLISEADAAMYRAKERGRDRIETFDDTMRARATSRLQVATDLAQALDRGELHVAYQPIVQLDDEQLRGAEALLRWVHPVHGPMSPADFIPIAEQTGSILEIGAFVLHRACLAAARWRTVAGDRSQIPVSVNVSLRQIQQPGFPALVAEILGETGLPARLLNLEITESVLMEEPELSLQALDAIRALGVRLVLDDFGTGYSSLAYVRRFPLDAIKIDRSFVADLDAAPGNATIVEAIVTMARGLGLDVITEGVETAGQARRLRGLGCDLAQGWLYAPALDEAALHERIAAGHGVDRPLS